MPTAPIHNPVLRQTLASEFGMRQISFAPIAADPDWFKTSTNFGGAANESDVVTSFTKDYCPGWPVVPVTVITDDAADDWTGVAVTYYGIDQFGQTITDVTAAANSAGTWTSTSLKAFRELLRVTITVAGTTTSSDAYVIGFVKTYGLGSHIEASGDVIATIFNGSADAGTISVPHQTYVIAGTPDAADTLMILIEANAYLGY